MIALKKLKTALDTYDPYGLYRVNAFQTLFVITGLFLINAVFNFPQFTILMNLPIFGMLAICVSMGYGERLKTMLIYSIATIIYSVMLSIVQNYRFLTVLTVGIMILLFFTLSKKKYPILLGIIPIVHIAAYTTLIVPFADSAQLTRWILGLIITAGVGIGLLALFPRHYFFRIWLRVLYLSINELDEKLRSHRDIDITTSPLLFKHLNRVPIYTAMLSNKENGFAARRISLSLTRIYQKILALMYHVAIIQEHELQEIQVLFHQLGQALIKNQPFHDFQGIHSERNASPCFLQLRQDLFNIIGRWNQLCLKQ